MALLEDHTLLYCVLFLTTQCLWLQTDALSTVHSQFEPREVGFDNLHSRRPTFNAIILLPPRQVDNNRSGLSTLDGSDWMTG